MRAGLSILILIFLLFSVTATAVSQTQSSSAVIPQRISNNSYYQESVRFNKLAQSTYESGDYEASAGFAQEAMRFTRLSDEYVATKLIEETERLKALAEKNNIIEQFPNNYKEGVTQYEYAKEAHSVEAWNSSITSSINAIEIFGVFASTGKPPASPGTSAVVKTDTDTTDTADTTASGLPRQYTVRTWVVEKDCFWNIAGYPWVYGDPWKWRILYEANKSKLPDPENPDLMEPGMILEIPSLTDEARQGMWRPGTGG